MSRPGFSVLCCRAPPRAAAGFSLVEVLCALIVLGTGVVGITEGITLSLRMVKESEYQTAATLLASSRIETIRAEQIFSSGEDEGEFGEDFPLYSWRQSIVDMSTPGLYEVTVSVDLAESGEELYELKTLLFKPRYSSLDSAELGSTPPLRGGY